MNDCDVYIASAGFLSLHIIVFKGNVDFRK